MEKYDWTCYWYDEVHRGNIRSQGKIPYCACSDILENFSCQDCKNKISHEEVSEMIRVKMKEKSI